MKLETYIAPKTNFTVHTVYWKLTKSDQYIPILRASGTIDSVTESALLQFYITEEFYDDATFYRIIDFTNLQNNTNAPFSLNPVYPDRFIFIKGNFEIEENNVFDRELAALNYCSAVLKKTYYDGKARIYDYKQYTPEFIESVAPPYFFSFDIKHDPGHKVGYFKITGTYPGPTNDLDDDIREVKRGYVTLHKFLKFSGVEHLIIDISDFQYQYLDKYLQDFIPTYADFENNPSKVSYIIHKETDTTFGFVKHATLSFSLDEALHALKQE